MSENKNRHKKEMSDEQRASQTRSPNAHQAHQANQETSRLLSARSSISSMQPNEEFISNSKKKKKRLETTDYVQDDDDYNTSFQYEEDNAENFDEDYDLDEEHDVKTRSQLIPDNDDDYYKDATNDTTNENKNMKKSLNPTARAKKSSIDKSITDKPTKSSLKKSLLSQMRSNSISRRLSSVSSNINRSNLTSLAEFKRQQQVMQHQSIRFRNDSVDKDQEELNDHLFDEEQQALSSSSSNSFNNRGILKNNQHTDLKTKKVIAKQKMVAYQPPNINPNSQNNQTRLSVANAQQSSGYIQEANKKPDYWGHILVGLSYFFLIVSFPFSLCTSLKIAQEYERAVIFRLGRVLTTGERGPGIFFVLPCIDTYTKVDLRTVTFDVPPQEILTRDSVTVSVDAVVYFRIFNAVISVINVEDAAKSTKLLAASTLRNILGTKSLHEILSDRESVAISIQNNLDEATEPWVKKVYLFKLFIIFNLANLKKGVKVERVEVKDVRLPVQLQRAMATEAEATREARAKVIAAEGEQKASKALKEAAEVISISPIAIQLRYLQTLTQIASEKNSTIVFPIPLEFLSILANKGVNLLKKSR